MCVCVVISGELVCARACVWVVMRARRAHTTQLGRRSCRGRRTVRPGRTGKHWRGAYSRAASAGGVACQHPTPPSTPVPAPTWQSRSSSSGASAADSIRHRRHRRVRPGSAAGSSARLPAICVAQSGAGRGVGVGGHVCLSLEGCMLGTMLAPASGLEGSDVLGDADAEGRRSRGQLPPSARLQGALRGQAAGRAGRAAAAVAARWGHAKALTLSTCRSREARLGRQARRGSSWACTTSAASLPAQRGEQASGPPKSVQVAIRVRCPVGRGASGRRRRRQHPPARARHPPRARG